MPPPKYSQAVEFNFNKQTLGNSLWQQRFGYPETGLSICVAQHGDSRFGYAIGLYPTIQFRLVNFKNAFAYFKLGGGIGINTKSWKRTPYNDSMNNIVGSAVNNFTMLQIGFRHKITHHWSVQGGVHFYHVSNAGARKPNFGINTAGAHLGVNYHMNGFRNTFMKYVDKKRYNPFSIGLQSIISFAEDKTLDGPIYTNYGFSLMALKMYRGKSRAGVGIEGTYNSKLYSLFKSQYNYVNHERAKAWQYSAYLCHEFVFGKIGLPLQLGYYFNRQNGGEPIYQKLGITYHFYHRRKAFVKDMYFTTQLKTHYATADFAEWGLGILF